MRHSLQQSTLRAFSSRPFIHSRIPVKYHQLANYRFTQTVAASNIIPGQNSPSPPRDLQQASTSSLIRAYIVYSSLSFPYFVDAAPTILKFATSIPIIKQLALFVIRNTFFKHFVGGDTIQDTVPLVNSLRERNLGSIVAYSVEVDEEEAKHAAKHDKKHTKGVPLHEKKLQEFLSSITFAGKLEDSRSSVHAEDRRLYVAIKLSALLPSAETLVRFSQALVDNQTHFSDPFETDLLYKEPIHNTMTHEDVAELRILHSNVKKIGELAVKHRVRILMDAEHTWYQPAIDAFSTDLMRTCNSISHASPVNPIVYLTYQAYLRSTPERLRGIIKHAAANNYVLGVKLVRGAYIVQEEERHYADPAHRDSGIPPPVWSEKHETDACYNQCATMLLDYVAKQPPSPSSSTEGNTTHVGLLFGTHNRESCDIVMDELVRRDLATVEDTPVDSGTGTERTLQLNRWVSSQVQFAQLYGMADELTNYVACRLGCNGTPTVNKFIPYGKLEDVMPYLSRRAIENKSVLGNSNTSIERTRVYNELKRRLIN